MKPRAVSHLEGGWACGQQARSRGACPGKEGTEGALRLGPCQFLSRQKGRAKGFPDDDDDEDESHCITD